MVLMALRAMGLYSTCPCITAVATGHCFVLLHTPHRGGTPENTLIAISQSEQKGAVGIEVDLAFTKDRHPVLLHDTTVDRTCDGSGDIETLTLDEVRKFDFGIKAGCVCKY